MSCQNRKPNSTPTILWAYGPSNNLATTDLNKACQNGVWWGQAPSKGYGPNYVTYGAWGNNSGNGKGSWFSCDMNAPNPGKEYACCTKTNNEAKVCSNYWCPASEQCATFMKNYCSTEANYINDSNCFILFGTDPTAASSIATLCKDSTNFKNPNCQTFCQNQVTTPGSTQVGSCFTAATQFCQSNQADERCACINYNKTDDYKKLIETLKATTGTMPQYQCWASPCMGSSQWSSMYHSDLSNCPTTFQACNQNVDAASIKADTIKNIGSSCNLKSDGSSNSTSTNTTTEAEKKEAEKKETEKKESEKTIVIN